MGLAKMEQETVIQFSRDSDEAIVWTSDRTVMTKLDKMVGKSDLWNLDAVGKVDGEIVDKKYICKDKKLISFRANRITHDYTDEQKAEMAERMRNLKR